MKAESKKPCFLSGAKTSLRPVEDADIPWIARWLMDPRVTYYMFYGQKPMTLQQVSEEIQRQISSPSNVLLTAVIARTKQPIGFAGIYDIHPTARKGEFRILVGEPPIWNRGYGTEITELLIYYGFDRLNLNRIYLGVTSENTGGIKAYEKAGFVHEGVLRADIYRNSRYYDTVRMSILREEYYRSLHKKHARKFSILHSDSFAKLPK